MRTGVTLVMAVAPLLAVCTLLAGCSTERPQTTSETTVEHQFREVHFASGSLVVGSPTTPEATTVPGAPARESSDPEPSPTEFGIADVRLEDGRAVVTFFGDGVVNYVGRYVDEALMYTGDVSIDVPGQSILQLDLISSPAPPSGSTNRPKVEFAGDGVVSVQSAESSDGVTQTFIGTSTDRPEFTVSTSQDPPSLVVAIV